jgi:excisionase family DNA binding protein
VTITHLTPAELANILDTSTETIRRYCRNGRIGHVKIGRHFMIPVAEAEKFVKDYRPYNAKAKD